VAAAVSFRVRGSGFGFRGAAAVGAYFLYSSTFCINSSLSEVAAAVRLSWSFDFFDFRV